MTHSRLSTEIELIILVIFQIVVQCNEAANRSEQAFEMELLSRQIEFLPTIRPLAIRPVGIKPSPGTKPRAIVKRGEMTHLIWRGEDGKLTFGKKFTKVNIYVFLFTDLMVLTKKRNDETYVAFDYCQRSLLTVSSGDIIPQLPVKDVQAAGKHLLLVTLLRNCDNKQLEMVGMILNALMKTKQTKLASIAPLQVCDCSSETERQRWLQATEKLSSDNPNEKLYEQWDCPQVVAKHTYEALQRDELNLEPGDYVNVTRKMADGNFKM